MTSVEIPVSIAAALPNLTVLDITNDVKREVAAQGGSGIAYLSPNGDPSLVRVQERETGFFFDLESLLERLVPLESEARARLIQLLDRRHAFFRKFLRAVEHNARVLKIGLRFPYLRDRGVQSSPSLLDLILGLPLFVAQRRLVLTDLRLAALHLRLIVGTVCL